VVPPFQRPAGAKPAPVVAAAAGRLEVDAAGSGGDEEVEQRPTRSDGAYEMGTTFEMLCS
jgi:hypothetical protein